jgi:hypothetical protein
VIFVMKSKLASLTCENIGKDDIYYTIYSGHKR